MQNSKQSKAELKEVERIGRFLKYFSHHFFKDNCLQHATALSYTTLLSIVPLMAVTLSVFTAFPIFDDISVQIQDFVFKNFVPTSSEVIQQYIQEFSVNAAKLTGPGLLFLLLTSIMMMAAIDKSLNTIWHNSKARRVGSRFTVYWSVLTLGPILIGLSLAISSYIISLPLFSETTSYGEELGLLRVLPFFMETLAFTLLYAVVPNCKVPFRSAFIGGIAAALLFELAKKGFSFYITSFPTYETIYGAMSTVPVFLVWIFLSWAITLIGAEFTWCLTTFRRAVEDETTQPAKYDLRLAYQLLYKLWLAQKEGRTLSTGMLLANDLGLDRKSTTALLKYLAEINLITLDEQGNWLLSHDMTEYRLADLYQMSTFQLSPAIYSENQIMTENSSLWLEINQAVNDKMDISFAELFKIELAKA